MKYSVHFFAAAADQLRQQMAADDTLAQKVAHRVCEKRGLAPEALGDMRQRVDAGRQGRWPSPAESSDFDAFLWMLDVLAEPIVISRLIDFKFFDIWEDVGVWRHFTQAACPCQVPRTAEPLPVVGYLPNAAMRGLLEEAATPTEPLDPFARAIRFDLLEVIESLAEDNLDLFAVVQ